MEVDPVAHIALPRIVVATESGHAVDAEQKAWVHASGRVLWELRRYCSAYLPRRQKLNLSHYLRDNKGNLRVWFETVGAVDALMESQHAVKDRDGQLHSYHHAEYSISTRGVIAMLLGSAVYRRVAAEKQLCFHVLVGLFRATNPVQVLDRATIDAIHFTVDVKSKVITWKAVREHGLRHCHLCRIGASGVFCSHMQEVLDEYASYDASSFHVAWARVLQRLFESANMCSAMLPVLQALAAELSKAIDESVSREEAARSIRGTELLTNPASKKRLRIDEDFKQFIAVDQAQTKQARSSADATRSSGIYHGLVTGNAREWTVQRVQAKVLAAKTQFQGEGVLSLAFDSKRLGKPAEETAVYALFSPSSGAAAWLPVMVPAIAIMHRH
eukprot:6492597-Amphidinium_carterae.7